jgi:protein gp37
MTNIEWTDSTWNPVIGCRHVAEGCRHCYAETMSKRLAAMGQKDYASILTLPSATEPGGKFNGKAVTRPETLAEPLRWKKPRMVFVNSMSDLFHEDVPFEFIAAVFGVMAACPQHTFQVLTKRPARALEFYEWADQNIGEPDYYLPFTGKYGMPEGRINEISADWPLKNVWLGVSAAHQPDADALIPILLKCPAAVRFVSAEPLVEKLDFAFDHECGDPPHWRCPPIPDWVIVGGESGPGARPCDIAWVRSIVEQCKSAGVPCFVKQLGADVRCKPAEAWPAGTKWFVDGVNRVGLHDRKGGDPSEWPEDLRAREFPKQEPAHAG